MISLTHGLFKLCFFIFQIFLRFISLFISNLISLWLVNILSMVSFILNLLRFVLQPITCDSWRMYPVHLKGCGFCKVECCTNFSQVKLVTVFFTSSMPLLTCCLVVLSVVENGVWKSPTIVELSFQSCQFLMNVFWSLSFRHSHL